MLDTGRDGLQQREMHADFRKKCQKLIRLGWTDQSSGARLLFMQNLLLTSNQESVYLLNPSLVKAKVSLNFSYCHSFEYDSCGA